MEVGLWSTTGHAEWDDRNRPSALVRCAARFRAACGWPCKTNKSILWPDSKHSQITDARSRSARSAFPEMVYLVRGSVWSHSCVEPNKPDRRDGPAPATHREMIFFFLSWPE